ncbi:MAG: tetratricopeptide repeat protein, partial [Proteobacteria bacterium]|nr:tetratricopeptide repeat protein [Pseudomonadota bacterium]
MSGHLATLLEQALALHRAGDLQGAEALYRRILTSSRRNFDAQRLLGLALYGQRRNAEAHVALQRAVRLDPR